MAAPKALVLRTAGTNCDMESAHASELAGFKADRIHINRIASGEVKAGDYSFLFIPGGFSYGDDLGAGKIMALELNRRLGDILAEFEDRGKLVLGVCNGFQVLIKTGFLPFRTDNPSKMRATLTLNDSAKFEARWVKIGFEEGSHCIFSKGLEGTVELPVAHAEGKFLVKSPEDIQELENNGQVALRYVSADGGEPVYPENPNGAIGNIAGVCNKKGTIFGLMPHPERFIHRTNHPRWTRESLPEEGQGMAFFRNAYNYCSHL